MDSFIFIVAMGAAGIIGAVICVVLISIMNKKVPSIGHNKKKATSDNDINEVNKL